MDNWRKAIAALADLEQTPRSELPNRAINVLVAVAEIADKVLCLPQYGEDKPDDQPIFAFDGAALTLGNLRDAKRCRDTSIP